MIKCIVVDDERVILDELCAMIGEHKDARLQAGLADPIEALERVKAAKPDAVFLDIEMPRLNGIELAKKIAAFDADIQIVFVTAYEQYALKAFEVCAVHYLLKPLTQKKVNEAVERIKRVLQMYEDKGDIVSPVFSGSTSVPVDRISVKDRDDIIIINIADIVYVKSEEGKTIVVTKKGSYKCRTGLLFWENRLKELDFVRCHRSYIVNAVYITKMIHILGEYKELVLDYCDINIPIGRQKIGAIKDWFGIK